MKTKAVIVGGGLWGGLLALFLAKFRPDVDFLLYESSETLGGNHTWSFHDSDIDEESKKLIGPLIRKSWPSYRVEFPDYTKTVSIAYHTISSELFHEYLVKEIPEGRIRLGERISLEEAKNISEVVFDCRGINVVKDCGYQKFYGIEAAMKKPHGLTMPVLMDAKVDQLDGFRFIYFLPYDEHTLLIEDTRYSENSFIDQFRMKEHIRDLIISKGWEIKEINREESGSLPIPFEYQAPLMEETVIDLKGIFHDTTGYSLPDAVKLLSNISRSEFTFSEIQKIIMDYHKTKEKNRRFFCLLNKMMFKAADDQERYKTLQYFYKSSEKNIKRFYSGTLNGVDRLMFFAGKPPVSVSRAMKIFFTKPNPAGEHSV